MMMNKFNALFLSLILSCVHCFAQVTNLLFEKTNSFHSNEERINKEEIECGYFTVPED